MGPSLHVYNTEVRDDEWPFQTVGCQIARDEESPAGEGLWSWWRVNCSVLPPVPIHQAEDAPAPPSVVQQQYSYHGHGSPGHAGSNAQLSLEDFSAGHFSRSEFWDDEK